MSALEKELTSDRVIVVTGMRRVGKTTLIRHLYDGVADGRKLYLDLENPLNQAYFLEIDYDKIKFHLERLAVGKGEDLVVFLDEIQNVKTLPSVVKYLFDHYQIKFILTGSASFYLKNLFSESLAGRKRLFELFPLDFEEFLQFKAPRIKKPGIGESLTKLEFDLLDKYQIEYLTYGGFPSVVLRQSHNEKLAEIGDIFSSYFQQEVRLLADFRKLDRVRAMMLLLMQRVGSKIDVSKIASELGVSRVTVLEYLDFLEGTYFMSRIRPYSRKPDVIWRSHPKPYVVDTGFLTGMVTLAPAARLENSVFNLVRPRGEVYFYQSKAGAEIDFVVRAKDRRLTGFEVKTVAHQSDVARLKRLAPRIGLDEAYVVAERFSGLKGVIYPCQLG